MLTVDPEEEFRDALVNVVALNTIKKVAIAVDGCGINEGADLERLWCAIEEIRTMLINWHGTVPFQQAESDYLDPLRQAPKTDPAHSKR